MWYKCIAGLLGLAILFPVFCEAQENPIPESDQHRWLQDRVGRWEARISVFIPGVDQPMKALGTETIRSLGPYWTITDLRFQFGDTDLASHGTLGFDPSKKKYVGTWLESVNPYPATVEGEATQSGDSIPLLMHGRTMDGQPDEYRILMLQKDKDHRTVEIQRPKGEDKSGEETQWRTEVRIEYTRDSAIPPPSSRE